MAQWIRRLTTDQEIPGSSPGRIAAWEFFIVLLSSLLQMQIQYVAFLPFFEIFLECFPVIVNSSVNIRK